MSAGPAAAPDLLARVTDWVSDGALALADLGYEGEPGTFTIPFKKPKDGQLSIDQQDLQCGPRPALALPRRTSQLAAQDHLQGAAPLSRLPWRIGDIVAAALVLLHHEQGPAPHDPTRS